MYLKRDRKKIPRSQTPHGFWVIYALFDRNRGIAFVSINITQLAKTINFEVMQKLTANSLEEINLHVGDRHTLTLDDRFSGKFFTGTYILNGVEADKISVDTSTPNVCVITAKKVRRTMFKIKATNPAG